MSKRGKACIAVRQRGDQEEIAFYGRRAGNLQRLKMVFVPVGDKEARRNAVISGLNELRGLGATLEE